MMRNRLKGRNRLALVSVIAGGFALALTAGAENNGLTIFIHNSGLTGEGPIGTGGDGSVVFYPTYYAFVPPEAPITPDDLVSDPYLSLNQELFAWTPGDDRVRQFTATSNLVNDAGDAYARFTYNEWPSVSSRSVSDPTRAGGDGPATRPFSAVAFVSNTDQNFPGPSAGIGDVDNHILALGSGGTTVFAWDSDTKSFFNVFDGVAPAYSSVGPPSVALKITGGSNGASGPVAPSVNDVLVAFPAQANPAVDNEDFNTEIFLWRRRDFLEPSDGDGFGVANNGGLQQLTHTTSGSCWGAAVNEAGQVAFVSNADITGENGQGYSEIFVWDRGRTRQITHSNGEGSVGLPSWGARSKSLVFDSNLDLEEGRNGDGNFEIFVWNGKRIRQVTRSTSGDNYGPSLSPNGKKVAFLSDADLPGLEAINGFPEVVVQDLGAKNVRRITVTLEAQNEGLGAIGPASFGGFHEQPIITRATNGNYQVTFVSSANLDGRNSNHLRRIYRSNVK